MGIYAPHCVNKIYADAECVRISPQVRKAPLSSLPNFSVRWLQGSSMFSGCQVFQCLGFQYQAGHLYWEGELVSPKTDSLVYDLGFELISLPSKKKKKKTFFLTFHTLVHTLHLFCEGRACKPAPQRDSDTLSSKR